LFARVESIDRELTALKRMFNRAIQVGKLIQKPHIPFLKEHNARELCEMLGSFTPGPRPARLSQNRRTRPGASSSDTISSALPISATGTISGGVETRGSLACSCEISGTSLGSFPSRASGHPRTHPPGSGRPFSRECRGRRVWTRAVAPGSAKAASHGDAPPAAPKTSMRITLDTAATFGRLAAQIRKAGKDPHVRINDLWLAAQAASAAFGC